MKLTTVFCAPVAPSQQRCATIIAAPVPVTGLTDWNTRILALLEKGRGK